MNLQYFVDRSPLIKKHCAGIMDEDICHVLRNAIQYEYWNEVAKEFFNLGFDPNSIISEIWDSNSLTWSCDFNIKEMMIFLLDKTKNLDHHDKDGFTSLMHTVKNNNIEFSKLLLERGANINFINKKGNTALIYAYLFNKYEMTKFLLQNGAKLFEGGKCDPFSEKEMLKKERDRYRDLIMKYNGKNIKPAKVRSSEEEE